FGALGLTLCTMADPASAQLQTRPLAPGKVASVDGQKAVFVVAHRGGAGLYPENTVSAVRHSLALGVDAVEIDVQLTADGRLVAYHDLQLSPTTTQAPYDEWLVKPGEAINDLSYEQLRIYDVGGVNPRTDYARLYPDQTRVEEEPIPLLSDIIEVMKDQGDGTERLWVEIKTDPTQPDLSGPSAATAEALIKLLKAEEFLDRTDILSFDWTALEKVRALHPISRRVYLTMDPKWMQAQGSQMSTKEARKILWGGVDLKAFDGSLPRAAAAQGGLAWAAFHGDLDAGSVAEAERLGLAVSAWTVNEPGRLRQMIALGVDSIVTDRPDVLLAMLGRLSQPVE
ncbi:MAG: glycerophosphodiester phosphodiesterase family protein, partial [Pseudomonadota bacterium]